MSGDEEPIRRCIPEYFSENNALSSSTLLKIGRKIVLQSQTRNFISKDSKSEI